MHLAVWGKRFGGNKPVQYKMFWRSAWEHALLLSHLPDSYTQIMQSRCSHLCFSTIIVKGPAADELWVSALLAAGMTLLVLTL